MKIGQSGSAILRIWRVAAPHLGRHGRPANPDVQPGGCSLLYGSAPAPVRGGPRLTIRWSVRLGFWPQSSPDDGKRQQRPRKMRWFKNHANIEERGNREIREIRESRFLFAYFAYFAVITFFQDMGFWLAELTWQGTCCIEQEPVALFLRVESWFNRCMKINLPDRRPKAAGVRAFTLAEVVMAAAIAALLCAAVTESYIIGSRRSQFAAFSLAANMQAMKKIEQVIFASWVPNYGITNVFNPALTNIDTENLEMPVAITNVATCTNYTTVTQISANPPYLMSRVDCVWGFNGLGTYTNTVAVLRGPNL
jgi:Tfp pilus assembly protein PilE